MATQPTSSKSLLSASPKIMHCGCPHKAQDELHGQQKRVHNPCKKGNGDNIGYRCTVCGSEK